MGQCLGLPAPLFWSGVDDTPEHLVDGASVESSKVPKSGKGTYLSSVFRTAYYSIQ